MGEIFKMQRALMVVTLLATLSGCASIHVYEETGYLRFKTIGRIPIVEGKINNKKAIFIVDSGASCSLLNESVAEYFEFKFRSRPDEYVHGIVGESKVNKAINCMVELGPIKMSHHLFRSKDMIDIVAVIQLRENLVISGIIGADILKQYKITIDFGNDILIFPLPASKREGMYARRNSWSQRVNSLD